MSGTFTLRPLRRRDLAETAAFFRETALLDAAFRPVSDDQWTAFVLRPSHEGGRDFRVARVGKRVVGVLVSSTVERLREGRAVRHFRPAVHPDYRRRGIGSAMLRTVERQRPGGPRPTLQCCVPSTWTELRRFLAARGFDYRRSDLELVRTGPAPADAGPRGSWTLRPFGHPGDASMWSALHGRAYARDFHFVDLSPRGIAVEARQHGFHAWMAVEGGAVVGICETVPEGNAGVIANLAVDPPWQGRGLGRALLRAGLRTLAAAGHRRIELCVRGDNAPDRALYASEGFVLSEEIVTLWRDRRRVPGRDRYGRASDSPERKTSTTSSGVRASVKALL